MPVDVSDIDNDTTKKVDLNLPDDIDEAEFNKVEAKIKTSKN